jgi:hypothetical protein
MLGEILDLVTAVDQTAVLAVDVRNRRFGDDDAFESGGDLLRCGCGRSAIGHDAVKLSGGSAAGKPDAAFVDHASSR